MTRQKIGEKKIEIYKKITGLSIKSASTRGGTDHTIIFFLEDDSHVFWLNDGTFRDKNYNLLNLFVYRK